MVEWMLLVFIIIHTEANRLDIMRETQDQDRIQLESFMQDMLQNPEKIKILEDLRKKHEK